MADAGPSSLRKLVGILFEAHRLRSVINQSANDTRLVRNDHIIHHMVDTSVFRIFAEPDEHAALVSAFPTLFGSLEGYLEESLGPDDDQEYAGDGTDDVSVLNEASLPRAAASTLFANALLTGEYIFRVAGASASGNERLLISPEHASEIHGYIINLARRTKRAANAVDPEVGYVELGRWLARQADKLGRVRSPNRETLGEIRRGMVESLAMIGDSALLAEQRLSNLFTKNRVQHAGSALSLPVEIISPPDRLVEEWKLRISNAKSGNRKKPNVHALEADAVTLAQLQLYNEDWMRTREACVLITDDRGLHRAYGAFLSEHGRGRRPFFALRDPRQYMPVLNVGEDTGGYTDARIFKRVRSSVEQLLTSFATTDVDAHGEPADATSWPNIRRLADAVRERLAVDDNLLRPFATMVNEQIKEIAQAWLDLLEYSLLAKADIVLELAEAEMSVWRNASRRLLRRELDGQMTRVSDQFLQLTESSALLRLEVRAFNQRTFPTSNNRRMPVSQFSNFRSTAFVGQTLPSVVDALRNDLGATVHGLQSAYPRERLLVIGCICLGIGAWAAASTLLKQADQPYSSEPRPRLDLEIKFFRSVARRLAASRASLRRDYDEAEEALRELLSDETVLNVGRVRMEQVALTLCRSAFLAFEGESFETEVQQAGTAWRLLAEWENGRIVSSQSDPAWQALLKQFALNTFCLLFWIWAARVEQPATLAPMAERLLVVMNDNRNSFVRQGVHGSIYPDIARFVLADDAERRRLAPTIRKFIDDSLNGDRKAGFLFDLPFIDKIELGYIASALAAYDAIVEPSQATRLPVDP